VAGFPPFHHPLSPPGLPYDASGMSAPYFIDVLGWYNGGMKEKTSITLSKEVLAGIDRIAGSKQSRSAFIEAVLTQYLRKRARAQVEARDLELINKAANELNAEVEDILRYQDPDA
jgi:hypothetical protein